MRARNGVPKAKVISSSDNRTTWSVDFENTKGRVKSYVAITYPDSDHVFLQSSHSGRAIAASKAFILVGEVKEAIAVARQQADAKATQS